MFSRASTATRRDAKPRCARWRFSCRQDCSGRGIFIPAGFDPDTFVRERGAAAFAELIEQSELLVDYFLSEQAREARGSIAGARARGAEGRSSCSSWSAIRFEFDLLARKAADLLGVGEEVLRKRRATQRGRDAVAVRARSARERVRAGSRRSGGSGDAGARPRSAWSRSRCCIRSCAMKSRESVRAANFAEIRLGEHPRRSLQHRRALDGSRTMDRRSPDSEEQEPHQRVRRRSATTTGGRDPKASSDLDKCRALANDFVVALKRRQTRREVDSRSAATSRQDRRTTTMRSRPRRR